MKKICMLLCAVWIGATAFAANTTGEAEQATTTFTIQCSIDNSLQGFGSYSYFTYTDASGVRQTVFINQSGTHRMVAQAGSSVAIRAQYWTSNVPIMLSVTGIGGNNDRTIYDDTLISEHFGFWAAGQTVYVNLSRW